MIHATGEDENHDFVQESELPRVTMPPISLLFDNIHNKLRQIGSGTGEVETSFYNWECRMRLNRWAASTALGGLLIGLLAIWNTTSAGQAPAAKPALAWEYKSTSVGNDQDLHKVLNAWGAQGWEMVTAYTQGKDGMGGVVYLFKRAKP